MRIGIDARLYQEKGIGRYIRNLIKNLQTIDQTNEYFIYLLKKDYDTLKFPKNFTKVIADFRWYTTAEQIKFPTLLKKNNLDLVHFPHFNIPVLYQGKFIVTIHDLIHQHFSTNHSSTHNPVVYQIKKMGYDFAFSKALKKSQKVITVSNFVKDQLVTEWNINDKKIAVTYEAVDEEIINYSKKMTKEKAEKVLKKFNIKPPYIFYVGNVHPHKNVESLIKSFLEIRKEYQYLTLVLSGDDKYFWKRLREKYQHKDIIYTGFISDEELVSLYKNAACYVCPSFEEGFGIPLLEAMACGCPVVSSKRASLSEVGGDAALYFNPTDLEDLSEKIKTVLNNQKVKKDLIEKGEKRYKEFSWKKMTQETLEIYKNG